MKKFTLGMVAGMSTLTLAIPLAAQLSLAATSSEGTDAVLTERPAPTQECLLATVALQDAHIANFDAMQVTHKTQMQSRRDALATVAAISDDTAREEALKQMHNDMRASMEEKELELPAAITEAMDAVKTACGDTFMFMKAGHHGPMMGMGKEIRGHRFGGGKLLEKLDMTEEEFKAALESGKTIEDIATEKGIDLSAKPEGFGGHKMRFFEKATIEPTE